MKIFLQRGNNAAFNDNKGNQQSARLLFLERRSNQCHIDIVRIAQKH